MLNGFVFALVVAWVGVLAVCDARTRRLPNALTLGGAAVALALRFGSGGTHGRRGLF